MSDSNPASENSPAGSPDPEIGPVGPAALDMADSAALIASLTAERDQLARERSDLYDRMLRARADFDNFRKRTERERREHSEYAGMEAVRELLPILDDFERALGAPCSDPEYARGMTLIYNRFSEVLKKLGLEPIESTGQQFDPNVHHAVEMAPTADVEDNIVLEEFRKGYNFKGRLLRPAMVKVAVRPS
jgi:molecular chaperone GrpE